MIVDMLSLWTGSGDDSNDEPYDAPILHDGDGYIISTESDGSLGSDSIVSTNSTLSIQSIGLGDEGVYFCVARNDFGSNSSQAGQLTVEGIYIYIICRILCH